MERKFSFRFRGAACILIVAVVLVSCAGSSKPGSKYYTDLFRIYFRFTKAITEVEFDPGEVSEDMKDEMVEFLVRNGRFDELSSFYKMQICKQSLLMEVGTSGKLLLYENRVAQLKSMTDPQILDTFVWEMGQFGVDLDVDAIREKVYGET